MIQNFDQTIAFVRWGIYLFKPMLNGILLVLILSVPMKLFEKYVFGKLKPKPRKVLSLISTLVAAVLVMILVVTMIVPAVAKTVEQVSRNLPGTIQRISEFLTEASIQYPTLRKYVTTIIEYVGSLQNQIISWLTDFSSNAVASASNFVFSFIGGLINLFLGAVFAVYSLLMRERLTMQFKALCYAFLPERTADRLVYLARLVGTTFSNFIAGQSTEALILGSLSFVIMLVLGLPDYALMIAVFVAICSFVPIFGAWAAASIGAIIIFGIGNGWQALFYVLLFAFMQSIDGNFIYPNVVGSAVGLPPIWVLFAVTLGSKMFGILGMILYIPLTSVIYTILKGKVFSQLQERGIIAEKVVDQSQTSTELDGNTPIDKVLSPPPETEAIEFKTIKPAEILDSMKKQKKPSK